MRARLLSTRAVVLLLLIVLVPACRGGAEPEPSAPPPPDPANPEPFNLVIDDIQMAPMGNAEILVGAGGAVDAATAEHAVEATSAALERYLNGQFVDEATRFGADAARALLQPGTYDALLPQQHEALGTLPLPVSGVITGPARGKATVLFDNGAAYAVSIEYEARLRVQFIAVGEPSEGAAQEHPVTQRGTVLFTAPSWAVESFELALDAPEPPPPPPPETTPDAEASA